jgi:hypothetical protein
MFLPFIGGVSISPGTLNPKNPQNIDQDTITLFSQDYSKISSVPDNVFIARLQGNKIYDRLYSTIYGTLKQRVFFNDLSKGLEYKITRNPGFPCGLLPVADLVFGTEANVFTGNLAIPQDSKRFCECASFPLFRYLGQPRQAGSFYICRLTPMVKCTYQISMNINTDDAHSFVELNSPGSKLIIQEINGRVVLISYFENSSGGMGSETIVLGNKTEKLDFEITFDGRSKTNTISVKGGKSIKTPFCSFKRQKLQYLDFSQGYIKFTSFLGGKGSSFNVNIFNITQKADRKLITAIGARKLLPFGLDGPHVRNTTEQGILYLNSKNNRGTLWFDIELLEQCSESDLEYLHNLVFNDSWEAGVHYSIELNSLPLEQAYQVMNEGYSCVYEKIGKKPTSWCSMRNRDNLTHAIYAYENLGMLWRNGDSGIQAEKYIGNLDDYTWEWWEPASWAGMVHPAFTHELDLEPAIKYSISRSKFLKWVDNCNSNGLSIVSFYEYGQINRNTCEASFDILQYTENSTVFKAHTNGSDAFVNVNMKVEKDAKVHDNTSDKFLDYRIEQDKSIVFRVENNHTYIISLDYTQ